MQMSVYLKRMDDLHIQNTLKTCNKIMFEILNVFAVFSELWSDKKSLGF